jgi:hypothetical protein
MPNLFHEPEASFRQVEALLQAFTLPPGARLMSLDNRLVAKGLQAELDLLTSRRAEATAAMSPEQQAAFDAALEELVHLAGALLHADLLYRRGVQEGTSSSTLLERCRAHQQRGFTHLDALVLFGGLAADEAARIRQGRGVSDLIDDVLILAQLFERHWSLLEPMQPLHADPARRLSPEIIQAMKADADALRAASAAQPGDPYGTLLRAQHLLGARWDRLRIVAAGGYAWANQPAWAAEGHPSLHMLFHRSR